MNVLVVGANGFVGRNICKRHLGLGDSVSVLCHSDSSRIPDGCDDASMDYIYDRMYLAVGNHSLSQEQNDCLIFSIGKILSNFAADECLLISSILAEYEDSIYAESKRRQESLVKTVCDKHSIVRATHLYGYGMRNDSLIPKWINASLIDKRIKLFRNPNSGKDYLHIDDLTGLCSKVQCENQAIAAVTGNFITNQQILDKLNSLIKDLNIDIDLSNSPDPEHCRFDRTAITKRYGWVPFFHLLDWMEDVVINKNIL